MNCQSCRIEIEELEMSESLSDQARAHLGACSQCAAFYQERLSLRRLVGSLEPVSAPPDFEFRLRARLAASGGNGNHRFSLRTFIASAPAISLAASFALLIAAVVVYNHFKSGPAINTQSNEIVRQQKPEANVNSSSDRVASTATPEVSTPDDKEGISAGILPVVNKRPRPHLAISNKNTIRQPRQLDARGMQIESTDIGYRPAPKITPAGESPSVATSSQPVEFTVRSSSQTMRVFVDDKSGGKHSVTLEPVIFGSQDLTGRNSQRVQMPQGIW